MNAVDFLKYISANERGRSLMARIALNTLGFARQCPVDIVDLRKLSQKDRAIVSGFLDWAIVNGDYRYADYAVSQLRAHIRVSEGAQLDPFLVLEQASDPVPHAAL